MDNIIACVQRAWAIAFSIFRSFWPTVLAMSAVWAVLLTDWSDRLNGVGDDKHIGEGNKRRLDSLNEAVCTSDFSKLPAEQDPLAQSEAAIKKMREINDRIPDKRFSAQVDSLEQSAREIYKQVKRDKEKKPLARQFFSSYLPLTVQLLETYDQLYHSSASGPNVRKIKRDIEENLDTIVVAFQQQVDRLFVGDSLEVTANLSALKGSMASAGLGVENPFGQVQEGGKA